MRMLFGEAYANDFGVSLWDGTRIDGARGERFVLQVSAPGALRSALTPPIDLSALRANAARLAR
ncbi:MAG: hypothetical protein WA814_10510 [Candidatus Baltobacteraceae bacterium]